MEAFLLSTGLVALGEFGGTTQLLAVLMAARFRQPVPLLLGILVATVLNHAVAGTLGWSLAYVFAPGVLAGPLAVGFVGMAVWTLIPQEPGDGGPQAKGRLGVFGASVLAFLVAEIGDRSQIAALALAARYHQILAVVGGSTLGMLLVDVPAVLFGQRLAKAMPRRLLRTLAALLFACMGVLTLVTSGARVR